MSLPSLAVLRRSKLYCLYILKTEMDTEIHTHSTLAYASWLLLQLLSAPQALYVPPPNEEEENDDDAFRSLVELVAEPLIHPHDTISCALHNFRLYTSFNLFDDDLGFWVKPDQQLGSPDSYLVNTTTTDGWQCSG